MKRGQMDPRSDQFLAILFITLLTDLNLDPARFLALWLLGLFGQTDLFIVIPQTIGEKHSKHFLLHPILPSIASSSPVPVFVHLHLEYERFHAQEKFPVWLEGVREGMVSPRVDQTGRTAACLHLLFRPAPTFPPPCSQEQDGGGSPTAAAPVAPAPAPASGIELENARPSPLVDVAGVICSVVFRQLHSKSLLDTSKHPVGEAYRALCSAQAALVKEIGRAMRTRDEPRDINVILAAHDPALVEKLGSSVSVSFGYLAPGGGALRWEPAARNTGPVVVRLRVESPPAPAKDGRYETCAGTLEAGIPCRRNESQMTPSFWGITHNTTKPGNGVVVTVPNNHCGCLGISISAGTPK
ncbi:hypothetical protein PAPYR_9350 [Paratrimastix pyriformis]|uniref:Uncharacterized protein n=1 Tax=Paratrimastix pyriformis TaxID=342808 RepID=A0ABQ8U8L2_9EUKA|nr:hypothetical protein PAPYR_9350 [Paratrimastix pyriformis]